MERPFIDQRVWHLLIFSFIILVLTLLAFRRNEVWKNDVSLWEDVVRKAPDNARAHNNLGRIYGAIGRNSEAIEEFKKAVNLVPNYAIAYMNMAVSYSKLGDETGAEFAYKTAISFSKTLPETYYNYGFFLYSRGRYVEAYKILNKYLELDSQGPFAPFVDSLLSDIRKRGYAE